MRSTRPLSGEQPPPLPKALQALHRRRKKRAFLYRLSLWVYCAIGAVLTFLSLVSTVQAQKGAIFGYLELLLCFMGVIILNMALLVYLFLWSLGSLKNAFHTLRTAILISYIGFLLILINVIQLSLSKSIEHRILLFSPHILALLSGLLLNGVVCFTHKGTLFRKRPREALSIVSIDNEVMAKAGKLRGDSLYKDSSEDWTCPVCCEKIKSKGFELARCGHRFHAECMRAWLQRQQTACPLCRGEVFA